jgi:hypothetical protein
MLHLLSGGGHLVLNLPSPFNPQRANHEPFVICCNKRKTSGVVAATLANLVNLTNFGDSGERFSRI